MIPGPPAVAVSGSREVRMALGAMRAKFIPFEVPPLGVGLNTVTIAVPTDALSLALIFALNCVLLMNVVSRSAPFQRTADRDTKSAP